MNRRGPTMLHHVHTRPLDKRKTIILNELGQPIGPITEQDDTVAEFARFLGTMARDYSSAPLTYKSWRKVPNKEKMWEYVLVSISNRTIFLNYFANYVFIFVCLYVCKILFRKSILYQMKVKSGC